MKIQDCNGCEENKHCLTCMSLGASAPPQGLTCMILERMEENGEKKNIYIYILYIQISNTHEYSISGPNLNKSASTL